MNKPEKILKEVKASMVSFKTAVNTIAGLENLFDEAREFLKQDEKNIKKSTLKSLLEFEAEITEAFPSVGLEIESYLTELNKPPFELWSVCVGNILVYNEKTGETIGFSESATERQKALYKFACAFELANLIKRYGTFDNIPDIYFPEPFYAPEYFDKEGFFNFYKAVADFNDQDFNELI